MMALPSGAFRGGYTPLITPFKDGAVDHASYANFIAWQIAEGVDGIVVAGTSGEPFALTIPERCALLETAIEAARGRVPVIAATGAMTLADSVVLTEHAEKAGAAAVMVLSPPFAKPPQRGLIDYFVAVARTTTLPFFLYQISSRTNATLTRESCRVIAEKAPNVVGMKQSDDDRALVRDLLKDIGPDFRAFMGLSAIAWDMIAEGASGFIVALANIVPRLVGDLYRAAAANRVDDARAIALKLAPLTAAAFLESNPIPVKYMAWRMGRIAADEHRLPLVSASPAVAARLDAALHAAGLL